MKTASDMSTSYLEDIIAPYTGVDFTAIHERQRKINKHGKESGRYLQCPGSFRYVAHALDQMEKSNKKTGHLPFLHNITYDSTNLRDWPSKTEYCVDLEQNSRNLLRDLGYTLRLLPSGNIEFWDTKGGGDK